MIHYEGCPKCGGTDFDYIATESAQNQCYDYQEIVTIIYVECKACHIPLKTRSVRMKGFIRVSERTIERLRKSGSEPTVTTADPPSSQST